MFRGLLPLTLAAAFLGGCYSDAGVGYSYGYSSPDLEYIAPGVQVVADYDYPEFYSDGYYWRYADGYWYQSPYWNTGWTLTYDVPVRIRGIREPWAYRHFHRGEGWIRDHRSEGGVWAGRTYRGGQHAFRPAPYRAPVYRPAPTYRRGPVYRPGPVYRQAPVRRAAPLRRGRVIRDHRHF